LVEVQPPPTIELPPAIEKDDQAILVDIPPTPVVEDEADMIRKRQVVISGPTSTLNVGTGSPGVQISTGGGSNNGTDSGNTDNSGGGLTKDQKIQLGVGIGLGLPGAVAGLIAIWAAARSCCCKP
jgi:hypothetical protein